MPELSRDQIRQRALERLSHRPPDWSVQVIMDAVIDVLQPETPYRAKKLGRIEREVLKVLTERSVLGSKHLMPAVVDAVVSQLPRKADARDVRRQLATRAIQNLARAGLFTLEGQFIKIEESLLQV